MKCRQTRGSFRRLWTAIVTCDNFFFFFFVPSLVILIISIHRLIQVVRNGNYKISFRLFYSLFFFPKDTTVYDRCSEEPLSLKTSKDVQRCSELTNNRVRRFPFGAAGLTRIRRDITQSGTMGVLTQETFITLGWCVYINVLSRLWFRFDPVILGPDLVLP